MSTETKIADKTVHRVVSFWKGDEPGSCGFECACGDAFDGFDSIAEAEACHKPLEAWVETPPADMPDKPEPDEYEPVPPAPDPRAEYIRGLREIADWLEAHPEVPLPWHKTAQTGQLEYSLEIYLNGDGQKAQLATIGRAMGKAEKVAIDSLNRFNLVRRFGGIAVVAVADREEVCTKVVTGVETVTKKVKDPTLLAAVPEVEVTEEVETYEWRCGSILGAVSS